MTRMPFGKPGAMALVSLGALLFSAHRLPAQAVAIAEVDGVVSDSSGKVIVGAQVSITETDKQTVRNTVTDATGRYYFPNLPVGPYRLEVRAPGFKDYTQSGLVLQVGNNVQINVTMQVGSVSERVEVSASAAMVETKETSVSQVIDERRINDLPLNGRQMTQLILLSGGSAYGGAGDTGSKTPAPSTTISVAGGQGNGTAYLLDGGDNTDAMSNVNMPFPFPDAVQEFSVETSAVSSRFGTHPGATVNVVTKSGTNQFHGDLFDYLRNGDTNARNFFAPTHDTLKRNQFGGTVGGKIITDKLFFFGGYQGTRNRSNPPQTISHIPNLASLNGDFSSLASGACQAGGKAVTLTDPTTGQAFPGNQIPVSRLNPQTLKIASTYLPATNDPCGKVTYGIPTTGDDDEVIGRIDWIQNEKHTLYGRYFLYDYSNPPVFDGHNLLTTTQAGSLERTQSGTIGDTYTFGPGTLNSLHVSINRVRNNRGPTNIPINPTLLGVNMYSAVPNFLLLTVTNYFSTFCGTCAPGHFNFTGEQAADDVDLIRGRHEIAFGFNFIRIQNDTISGFDENGSFTWNGSVTGLGLADFMLGRPSDFTQTNATPDDLRQSLMSVYVQDTFHMNPHITLNYGLRWEPTFSDPDKYGRGTSFNEAAFLAGQFSTVYPNAPAGLFFKGDKGIPAAMWNGHWANFAPRIGVVWNPHGDGRDTLRAGGAILYDSTETWYNERETTNAPIGTALDTPNPAGGFSNPWQGYPGGNPFPTNGKAYFPNAGVYVNMPINPKPTYVAQWNVTYQRQFAGNWMASVSYLGNKTTHLWIGEELNPAVYIPGTCGTAACSTIANTNQRRVLYLDNPTLGSSYSSITNADDGAVAHYEGLMLSVQHRFGHNYTVLANYTDSYCVSDYDFGAALAASVNSQPFNRSADRGPCNFDTRHNFGMSVVATSTVKGNPWAARLLSNWQLAPLFHAASGQPLTVTTGADNSRTGLNNGSNDRPDQVLLNPYPANHNCAAASGTCVQWVNAAAFTPNPVGTFGNVGRDAVRGPGDVDLDVALSRMFKLTERFSLQARAEAFNLLNHPNFVGAISPAGQAAFTVINANLSSSSFGQIQSAFDPRILQFALKLYF
ncbi:MAG TPA: carboxypeptidase-like regulatory domain-containing protein [Bryobacteraceae bacterium]|nr:carboxypeptidase-like regulatory domain-containing protein [Bryobacteraceae bacterium]